MGVVLDDEHQLAGTFALNQLVLWMEEIVHQLIGGLSHCKPPFTVYLPIVIVTNWCRISSIQSRFGVTEGELGTAFRSGVVNERVPVEPPTIFQSM